MKHTLEFIFFIAISLLLLFATAAKAKTTNITAHVKFVQGSSIWFSEEHSTFMMTIFDHISVLDKPTALDEGQHADELKIVDIACNDICVMTIQ